MRLLLRFMLLWGGVFMLVLTLILSAPLLPYGGELVYAASYDGFVQSLYLMDYDRLISVVLVRDSAHNNLPSWSEDGGTLLYLTGDHDVIYANTARVMWISRYSYHFATVLQFDRIDGASLVGRPALSPDADGMLVIQSNAVFPQRQLRWQSLSGTASAMVSFDPVFPTGTQLRWLDDDRARFAVATDTMISLWEVRLPELTFTELNRWSHEFLRYRLPLLSPDGTRVIVPGVESDVLSIELYRFDEEHEGAINITNRRTSNNTSPVWSPNGKLLAHKLYNGTGQYIVVTDEDGNNERLVYENSQARVSDLSWAGDNQRLVFLLDNNRYYELCTLVIATGDARCTVDAPYLSEPTWRP